MNEPKWIREDKIPSILEWMEEWNAARYAGETRISRHEALKRYFVEVRRISDAIVKRRDELGH